MHDNTYNFQQWMSRLPQRWWTQRNAIRNANCKTSWIIKILNAHCALRKCLRAYLFECLYTPLIPVMYVMYIIGDGLWFWTLRKRPSLLECIWQVGTCLPVDRPACSGETYFMYWLLEIVRQIGQRGMKIRKPNFPNDVVVKDYVVWKGRSYVGMIWHVLFCACWVWLVYLWAL